MDEEGLDALMRTNDFDAARTGTGTLEWAELNENIQIGCANGCLYCYAAYNADRFKLRKREEWTTEELTNRAVVTSYPTKTGVIMFPSSHDITPFNVDRYIRLAALMLKKGNKLLIVTKPRLDCMVRVMDALEPWKDQILFRFTIGTLHASLTKFWEPNAPIPTERLVVLAKARERGFRTSISIEPMLGDVIGISKLVEQVSFYQPETIWIGKMNKIGLRVKQTSEEISFAILRIQEQQSDDNILKLADMLKGNEVIRWKDSIKIVIEKRRSPLKDVRG